MSGMRQAMMPHGWAGRIFGKSMDLLNRHAFKAAAKGLAVQPGDSILEIGFGTGALVQMLSERSAVSFVAGVDPSPLMLETASRRNRRAIASGRVKLRSGDASRLDWPDETFNKVCAVHSFQFWADPDECLREVYRVLRPGGLLLLILRNHRGGEADAWLPNPISRAADETAGALDALKSCGFVSCESPRRTRNSPIITARKP